MSNWTRFSEKEPKYLQEIVYRKNSHSSIGSMFYQEDPDEWCFPGKKEDHEWLALYTEKDLNAAYINGFKDGGQGEQA